MIHRQILRELEEVGLGVEGYLLVGQNFEEWMLTPTADCSLIVSMEKLRSFDFFEIRIDSKPYTHIRATRFVR